MLTFISIFLVLLIIPFCAKCLLQVGFRLKLFIIPQWHGLTPLVTLTWLYLCEACGLSTKHAWHRRPPYFFWHWLHLGISSFLHSFQKNSPISDFTFFNCILADKSWASCLFLYAAKKTWQFWKIIEKIAFLH